ncbi:MAG: hypothetical protein ACI9S8_001813 [Chlamydiales bacterium]|jgi:hypothetical protein
MASNDFSPHADPYTDAYTYTYVEQVDGTAASYLLLEPEPKKNLGRRVADCFASFVSLICPGRDTDHIFQAYCEEQGKGRVKFSNEVETLCTYIDEGNRLTPVSKEVKKYGAVEVPEEEVLERNVNSKMKQKVASEWAALQHEVFAMELEGLNPGRLSYSEAQRTFEKLCSLQEQLVDPKYQRYAHGIPELFKEDQYRIQKLIETIPAVISDYENAV